ncbi:MAG: hypothetical protein QOG62_74 [Thermoleophilaceae bacterium]|nr:hypothetical protein [Thermoleophilaceae bacterium]
MRKVVLITGGSSGIGQALAMEMAGRGYDLGLAARRVDAMEELKRAIGERHPEATVELRALDVTDYASVPGVIEDLAAALGRLDIVVVNAGVGGSRGLVGAGNFDKDRRVIETNVIGAMATGEAAMRHFRAQKSGQIVLIGSVAGFRGLPGSASYSVSKAAINTYGDALRNEAHGTPIKVTTLNPGYIDTPINQDLKSRPFLIDVEKGARIVASMIESGVGVRTVPRWPWNVMGRVMRVLPTGMVVRMSGGRAQGD